MIHLPRVAARIFGEPLAIERGKLEIIVGAVGPRLRGIPLKGMYDPDEDDPASAKPARTPAVDQDGIATINISGTLVSKASGMDAMSGLTSYADIAAQFTAAMENPSVRGVLLSIDSPGGEVAGMFDLADLMYQARGQKPICAVVNCAASAAYLLASTADQILVSRTGITGSIGIIALHLDESAADEKAGLKYTAIYAGARKNDGNPHEPLTPEARNTMQARIDAVYGMFTAAVAKNRGMSDEAVRGTQAAIYMGQDGVNVGLADAVGTADDAAKMIDLAASQGAKSLYGFSISSSVASATGKGATQPMTDPKQPVQAEAKVPTAAEIEAMVSQATQTGRAEAALIANMCAIAGKPERVAEFLSAGKTSAQVGAELLAAKVAADKASAIDPSVMPGVDASVKTEKDQPQGKAKPWSEIMAKLAGKKVA